VLKNDRISKAARFQIGTVELPRPAGVGGFVEAGQVAFAARHDYGGVGVKGLNAAKVEVLGF